MTIFWKIAHFLYSKHINHLARLFEEINYIICGNAISAKAKIDESSKFWHRGVGCVVHFNAIIGKDCKIFPNVMIGDAFKKVFLIQKRLKLVIQYLLEQVQFYWEILLLVMVQ